MTSTAIEAPEHAVRMRLDKLSIPSRLHYDAKGLYLGHWISNPETTVEEAATAAGCSSAAVVRTWRNRDPEFAEAERRVRHQPSDEVTTAAPARPQKSDDEIRAGAQSCADRLQRLGQGPWTGTKQTDIFNRGVHSTLREILTEFNAELHRRGLATFPVPPEANARPRRRRRTQWPGPDPHLWRH